LDFADIVHIEDDDDDGVVSFKVNTRLLGLNGANADISQSDVYDAGDDKIVSTAIETNDLNGELTVLNEDGNAYSGVSDFDDYLGVLGITDGDSNSRDSQLARPAQPTDYEVYAAADGQFVINDDDEVEVENELDTAVLELQSPTVGDVTTHVAPADDADADTELDEVLDAVTQRSDVALDDRLIVQYEASGIYGQMLNQSTNGWDILEDGTDVSAIDDTGTIDGIELNIEAEEGTGNQDPNAVDFAGANSDDVFVILDEENQQFFVVVNTESSTAFTQGTPDEGASFGASLAYTTDDEDRFEFAGGPTDVYPYFQADSVQESSSQLDFEDAEITFDNVNVDDVLEAENIEDAEISGTTNVAPGTDAELRVSSTDSATSFRNGQSVNISEDGAVSTEFDFSSQEVGDLFETAFSAGSSNVNTVDSEIVEEGSLSEDAPEDDESEDDESEDDGSMDDGESTDDGESSDDGGSTDDGESSDDSSSEETPGFGAIVALVAVLGAALLATRRQN
jgi:PGF-CTERM protein